MLHTLYNHCIELLITSWQEELKRYVTFSRWTPKVSVSVETQSMSSSFFLSGNRFQIASSLRHLTRFQPNLARRTLGPFPIQGVHSFGSKVMQGSLEVILWFSLKSFFSYREHAMMMKLASIVGLWLVYMGCSGIFDRGSFRGHLG